MKKDDTKIAPKTVRTADRSLKCFKVPRVYYCIVEEKNFVSKSHWVDRQQTGLVKKPDSYGTAKFGDAKV